MRIISYVFLLLVIIIGFTFACLNAGMVNINYYIGTSVMPLSMLLVVALTVGILTGVIFSLPWVIRNKIKARKARARVKELERTQALQATPPLGKSDT